ncbi:MAG: tyrosine-type recombinase/integrase [Rhizomicrobium sp.]
MLTDQIVRALLPPKSGMSVLRDDKVRGLGVRVLPSGTRAFVLDYTANGRRRIYTIGKFPEYTTNGARAKAAELKDAIKHRGADPAREAEDAREAPTVADLCERFKEEHLPKLRASTRSDYSRMMENDILPRFGKRKVVDIKRADVEGLHRAIKDRDAPTSANFCLALCSKLFNFAIDAEWIEKNPAKGVKRNPVEARTRYLTKVEIISLTKALNGHPDQNIADLFRLLLLTGARRGETRSATWDQVDLAEGNWTKPSHATKQKREHRVPLAAPARALLSKRRALADADLKRLKVEVGKAAPEDRPALEEWRRRVEGFVFPAKDGKSGHVIDLKKPWAALCKKAGIPRTGKNAARIHDLRHTAASVLASSGASLPLIGQLLGHTQVTTTARYAHLFDDAQRDAVERLGAVMAGGPSAKIVQFKARGLKRS